MKQELHAVRRARDAELIAVLQEGLPLVARPYAAIGARIGMSEDDVRARLCELQAEGTIKRFGVVVRHHELGYRSNAMVVWDAPDERVTALGQRLAALEFVTLCYRRARQLPAWPYNLYCMIHGRDRASVQAKITEAIAACGLQGLPHEVLFSRRRFKQCGARYVHTADYKLAAGAGK
jgi:DNA-binding Lrp family transcriptional regulator